MDKNINVEAEGKELILENEFGDKVIIPKAKRNVVLGYIKNKNYDLVDKLVATLPSVGNYAEEGMVFKNDPPNKEDEVFTYKSNPDYFDNKARYSDDDRYSDLIRKKIYAGTHGFNPNTGTLVKLDQPVKVPAKEQEQAREDYYTTSTGKTALETQRKAQVAQSNKEMAQNPLFYSPGIAAGGAALAASSLPAAVATGINAPIGGVAGLTANNLFWALGAGLSGDQILDSESDLNRSIAEARNNPTAGNIASATGNVALTGLNFAGLSGTRAGLKSVADDITSAGNFLTTKTSLRNTSKLNPIVFKPKSTSSVDDASKSLTQTPQVPKSAWQMQELPGLHLKSTMEGEAISKIIEPKTGLINTEQALAIIGKESRGADKVALIRQGLGDNIPKKIDFNEFRKVVQDQLIPLEKQFSTSRSHYGLNKLGYPSIKRSSFETAIENNKKTIKDFEDSIASLEKMEQTSDVQNLLNRAKNELADSKLQLDNSLKQMNKLPLENQTLILGNKSKFGRVLLNMVILKKH